MTLFSLTIKFLSSKNKNDTLLIKDVIQWKITRYQIFQQLITIALTQDFAIRGCNKLPHPQRNDDDSL